MPSSFQAVSVSSGSNLQGLSPVAPVRHNAVSLAFCIAILYVYVFSGLAQYYLDLQIAYQLNYVVPICLLAVSAATNLRGNRLWPTFARLLIIFYLYIITLCFVFLKNGAEIILGLRIYLPTMLVFLAIALINDKRVIWKVIETSLLVFPLIQLPFVLHQHFVIAPSRGLIGWDAVVGTLTGSQTAGGDNAGLALLCCCSILIAYYRMRTRTLSMYVGLPLSALNFIIIGLGEVKIILILLPVLFLSQRGRNIYARPAGTFAMILAAALVGTAFVQVYSKLYWSQQQRDVEQSYDATLEYFFDPNFQRTDTGEISRAASWSLWINDNRNLSLEQLFGNGPGSTRGPLGQKEVAVGSVELGEVAKRYVGVNLNATGIAQILWDLGIIGTLLFIVSVLSAIFRAAYLAKAQTSSLDAYRYRTVGACLITALLFMVYNNTFLNLAAEQVFLGVVLGLLVVRGSGEIQGSSLEQDANPFTQ